MFNKGDLVLIKSFSPYQIFDKSLDTKNHSSVGQIGEIIYCGIYNQSSYVRVKFVSDSQWAYRLDQVELIYNGPK